MEGGCGAMTAEEIKEALRGRHPALDQWGNPGPWTTIEEWDNVDLLAFSAWRSAKPPIVGYEVKVSRSDYRRELLKPGKRALAVESCWQFYFAVPKGLLTKEEKAYVEPEHFEDGSAFVRQECPSNCRRASREPWGGNAGTTKTGQWTQIEIGYGDAACTINGFWRHRSLRGGGGKVEARAEFNPAEDTYAASRTTRRWDVCETCEGRGYLRQSVVEQEAPTLWIPSDVGLIEVGDDGKCRTVRKAPSNKPTRAFAPLGKLIRWVSYRPDTRHAAERERQASGAPFIGEAA